MGGSRLQLIAGGVVTLPVNRDRTPSRCCVLKILSAPFLISIVALLYQVLSDVYPNGL